MASCHLARKGGDVRRVFIEKCSQLGELLLQERMNRGLSLRQVEAATGVSIASQSQWENSKMHPRIDQVIKLLVFYGVAVTIGARPEEL